ncbi:hypothetical protein ZOSMA_547G00020 [Zostera marina]|uniref:Uncharacterized protein n=1 Tax=Zostera marina TaxID=29655 RepID=A0A0K9NYZ8_ZOSMR|nr:hypothetical protein ZOSMA_547G00020 [Zostera marina]
MKFVWKMVSTLLTCLVHMEYIEKINQY